MSEVERRYRLLLALYPRDHRETTGEEMLGVLLAGAGDRRAPGWRDYADLLWGAVRLHLRRAVAADGGIDPRDVLAIVSLLAPMALLAGASTGLQSWPGGYRPARCGTCRGPSSSRTRRCGSSGWSWPRSA